MVACYAEFVAFAVADNILFGKAVELSEIDAKLYGLSVNGRKIQGIS